MVGRRQREPLRGRDLLGGRAVRLVGHPEEHLRRSRDRLDSGLCRACAVGLFTRGGRRHRVGSSPWYKCGSTKRTVLSVDERIWVLLSASTTPRLAVVTGAASGIGRATASALRDRGTEIVGVDLAAAPE